MVEKIFGTYTNHYLSNPYLQADLTAGYSEWAKSYAHGGANGRKAWLVQRRGEYIGFATCESMGDECEGVLYGVVPEASGGGVYGDIIRYTQAVYRTMGCTKMYVSTQVNNYAVQKVWSREGFFLSRAYVTVHVNSMLENSVVDAIEETWEFSDDDIEAFGALSGDRNALHFKDDVSRDLGFSGRIVHGALLGAKISAVFGTKFPGNGTIYVSESSRFLRPVYPHRPYKALITFPVKDEASGRITAVARISEPGGELCLLSYGALVARSV